MNQKENRRKIMKVKFSQAAEVIGVTSRTLLNKVKNGKMSAEKLEGVYFVDVSELARTFDLSESQLNLLTGNKTKQKEISLESARTEIELKHALEKITSLENQL
jgi:DNA-binding Xre family transcriptional regulator